MQRNVGPGALLRLIGGALRLNGATFRNAVSATAETRLHLAIVAVAALSKGFAYSMEPLPDEIATVQAPAVYQRLLLLAGVGETAIQFVLFVAAVYLLRRLTRRPPLGFAALSRLLALVFAPVCFTAAIPLLSIPNWAGIALVVWPVVIAVVGLRVGAGSSWIGALFTVLVAAYICAPLVHLLLFGVPSGPSAPLLPA